MMILNYVARLACGVAGLAPQQRESEESFRSFRFGDGEVVPSEIVYPAGVYGRARRGEGAKELPNTTFGKSYERFEDWHELRN